MVFFLSTYRLKTITFLDLYSFAISKYNYIFIGTRIFNINKKK